MQSFSILSLNKFNHTFMDIDINKISNLISEKLNYWVESIIKLLPNIALAALVMVIGFYIAKFIRKIASKLIHKISKNA